MQQHPANQYHHYEGYAGSVSLLAAPSGHYQATSSSPSEQNHRNQFSMKAEVGHQRQQQQQQHLQHQEAASDEATAAATSFNFVCSPAQWQSPFGHANVDQDQASALAYMRSAYPSHRLPHHSNAHHLTQNVQQQEQQQDQHNMQYAGVGNHHFAANRQLSVQPADNQQYEVDSDGYNPMAYYRNKMADVLSQRADFHHHHHHHHHQQHQQHYQESQLQQQQQHSQQEAGCLLAAHNSQQLQFHQHQQRNNQLQEPEEELLQRQQHPLWQSPLHHSTSGGSLLGPNSDHQLFAVSSAGEQHQLVTQYQHNHSENNASLLDKQASETKENDTDEPEGAKASFVSHMAHANEGLAEIATPLQHSNSFNSVVPYQSSSSCSSSVSVADRATCLQSASIEISKPEDHESPGSEAVLLKASQRARQCATRGAFQQDNCAGERVRSRPGKRCKPTSPSARRRKTTEAGPGANPGEPQPSTSRGRATSCVSASSELRDRANLINESVTYKSDDIEHTDSHITVTHIKTGQEVTLSNQELISCATRDLNRRVLGFPRETVSRLKQRRRTLKNRGYAQNCRQKRLEQKNILMEENKALREENVRLRREIQRLKTSRMLVGG